MNKKMSILIIALGVFICLFCGTYYLLFRSMALLPQGEFLCESTSPYGTYTVNLYETNPTLSVGGTRGELINNKTGKKSNIYWEYARILFEAGLARGEIIWEKDDIVIINGRRLNLPKDIYDWRRN